MGKLYNLSAGLIAARVVDAIAEVSEARCQLVSQIGRPIAEPQIAELRARCARPLAELAPRIREIVGDELARVGSLWRELVEGRLAIDRWPFA